MRFDASLAERARSNKRRIVLPEGSDRRILQAADIVLQKGIADLTILGNPDEIVRQCKSLGLKNFAAAELLDYRRSPLFNDFVKIYYDLRKSKGVTPEQAEKKIEDRNYFAVMMVYCKKVCGMVSGADGTTADTMRPALEVIKTKPGCTVASSLSFIILPDGRLWTFGDCVINTNPTPAQLAEIAVVSAQTAERFGIEPRVAMLSYSTGGSGEGPDVRAVREAVDIARETAGRLPASFVIDGPIQFDAAVDPRIGAAKMPGSQVAGQATVLIFPDLNSGNICYKAVQQAANVLAIGPIIQGLNAPVNDLSRGASAEDIVNSIALTSLQTL